MDFSPGTWLADLCASEGLPFVLGHALSMKAIQGGKALTFLAHQLARAVYYLRRRGTAFNIDQCLNHWRDGTREPDASLEAHGISLEMVR
jgi:hypothetical protein